MQKRQAMEKAIAQILGHIQRIYDSYEERANNMSQDMRKKTGAQNDKKQKNFMQSTMQLQAKMINLVGEMDRSPAMKKAELRENPHLVKQCLQDIQSINKKKSLLFKVNPVLSELLTSTDQIVDQIRKQLSIAGQTKFLCCGTDGVQKFKHTMTNFRLVSRQWALLAKLQPKDSVQTFISPKYSQQDFAVIRNVLNKLWPQQTVRQVVREVVKKVQVSTGKPSRLIQANQYIYGINREENPSFGLKIYHQQAEKNDPAASSYLGQIYEQGILLPKNLKKSAQYYQKAMNGKQNYAFYRFAMALIRGQLKDKGVNRQDLQTGFKLLTQVSSENPSPEALIELGQFYEKGKFEADRAGLFTVPIDLRKAIQYYMRARALHIPRASNNLGVLYINNKFLSESNPNSNINSEDNAVNNIQKGMSYLYEAEKEGFAQAFYNLGCVHESGILGRKNQQQALMYYYKGGLKGDLQSRLKFTYQLMNQTSILKQHYQDHYKIAYRWLDSIIHKIDILEQNSPTSSQLKVNHTPLQKAEALFYLGLMYEYGFGMDKSAKKAFNCFSEASDLGYAAAKNKVGDCYFSGFGVKQDRKTAIGCYLQAAELKNSDALVNLGTIYLNGIPGIIQRNYNEAYKCFVKASDDQNSNAMIHLSYMYKSGLGLEKDQQMAKKLLEESAANRNPTALYMLKEFGSQFDEKVLFANIDNDAFAAPRRINLREVVPYLSDVKI